MKTFVDNAKNSAEGKQIAMSYFAERGISQQTIDTFQLGYSIDAWDDFSSKAIKAGFNKDFLVELGLSKQKEDGSLWDFFKGRIMFPIHNPVGKVIGFGGRVLKTSEKVGKYFNSPESEVYHKSQVLYGIHLAKRTISKEERCILVEGYTDVLSLYQAGIENVVSSSGTSLTEEQVKLIRKYTENLYILYDGDAAGIKAALRGLDIAIEKGLNVKIILLPDGEDPDSFVQKHGGERLREFIKEEAKDIITFKAKLFKDEAGSDPIKRGELVHDMIRSITLIPDHIKRNFYVKEVALLMGISEELIFREISKATYNKSKKSQEAPPPSIPLEDLIPQEESTNAFDFTFNKYKYEIELIKMLMNYGDKDYYDNENPFFVTTKMSVAEYIFQHVYENCEFDNPICSKLFYYIKSLFEKNEIKPFSFYVNHLDPEISDFSIQLANMIGEDQIHNWKNLKDQFEKVQYGYKYKIEIDDIIKKINIRHYQKISEVVKSTVLELLNDPSDDRVDMLKNQLEIQKNILEYIKNEAEGTSMVILNL